MEYGITEISLAEDGCLRIRPSSSKSGFEFVYRTAAGVCWNKELECFQSSVPDNWDKWDNTAWYKQIISVVKSELGTRLRLMDDTVFKATANTLETDIRIADTEVQERIDGNTK